MGERRILPTCLIIVVAVKKLLRKGCQAFLAQVTDTRVAGLRLEDVPVVNEYPDVFPKELPGLPLDMSLSLPFICCSALLQSRFHHIGWQQLN